jgi:hypothetical protein
LPCQYWIPGPACAGETNRASPKIRSEAKPIALEVIYGVFMDFNGLI